MKNYLMFALLMGAIASVAFGQFGVADPAKVDVACPDDECHVAPVFMGEGGFVGEVADGFDMVNFVVSCGNVTSSGSAMGDAGGIVRQAFTEDNGLACGMGGGSIQIHGLMDGGWYWINDMDNSAVSPLIAKDALAGDEVMPVDPGGVDLSAGAYGSLVKHAASGRVGILPHFVPSAPVDIPDPVPATVCMPEWDADDETFVANDMDCMLGDGGTTIVMTRMTTDGRSAGVSTVHRNPRGGSDVTVALDLWGNGSGHISNDNNVHLGWDVSVPSWWPVKPESYMVDFSLSLDADDNLGTGLSDAGITLSPGRTMEVPGPAEMVAAADRADGSASYFVDVATTVQREDGFHMDSDDAVPQCTQATHTVTDGQGTDTVYYQFQAATGDDPVNILGANFQPDGSSDGQGNWDQLQSWVRGHNGSSSNTRIKTVRVPNPGPDGHFGDDPETGTTDSPVDESTDDGNALSPGTATDTFELPAVVCATTPGESTMRYVGATVAISPDTSYCNRDNNRTALVYVLAYRARGMNDVTPMLDQHPGPGWRTGLNASTALRVSCPLE